METQRLFPQDIEKIADIIRSGGLVAIMTDTVYGLAASAALSESYEKLVSAKQRPPSKPFSLMVSNFEQIESVANLNQRQREVMKTLMPGAVTFVVEMKDDLNIQYTKDRTIGIRMADHPFVAQLIELVGSPVWLPSANLSGYETGLNSDMVLEQLDGIIDAVVIGESDASLSSSVFDLTTPNIVQYRQGPIRLEEVEAIYEKTSTFK